MTVNKNRSLFSHATAFVLAFAIIVGQTTLVLALPASNSATGEISVSGPASNGERPFVLVNGEPAYSGRSFLADSVIETTDSSSAALNFGNVGRVNLNPGTVVSLAVSETSITGTVSKGSIQVSNGEGVAVQITTPSDTITTEGTAASSFVVNVTNQGSTVSAKKGAVRYNNGRSLATQDDDDDDDDRGSIWIPIIVIGGAVGAALLFTQFDDDENDTVSPLR